MLYVFSKLFWIVAELGNLIVLALVAATVALYVGRRRARGVIAALVAIMVVITLLPLGQWAITPLETRFPQPTLPTHITGVILLGGAVSLPVSVAHNEVALNGHAERITETLALARRYPDAKVLVSGGNAAIFPGKITEAALMARILTADGLDPHRLLLEAHSRNTYENAVDSKALVRPQPGQVWLLVTSAFHMPRAMGCFNRVGWKVLPYPVDYQTSRWPMLGHPSFLGNLRVLDLAWHEWLGLVAYHLLGRTDAFFPGPA